MCNGTITKGHYHIVYSDDWTGACICWS